LTFENYVFLSGFALLIGGALATLGWLLFSFFDPTHTRTAKPSWMVFNLLVIFGGVFMALGLPGFYLAQSERLGTFGLIAFVILFIGIVIPYVAVHSIETATSPNVPPRMFVFVSIGAPSLYTGALLVGVLTYTAGVYPKWLAAGLLIGVILGLLMRLVPLPPVVARGGLISAYFTAVIALIGFYTSFRIGQ
jgi:predicted metal-binding membrane protein